MSFYFAVIIIHCIINFITNSLRSDKYIIFTTIFLELLNWSNKREQRVISFLFFLIRFIRLRLGKTTFKTIFHFLKPGNQSLPI